MLARLALAARRPQAPRRLKVSGAGAAGVRLTWAPPRGGTKPARYLVFRDRRRIARTTRRSYVDAKAKPGTRHSYQVVAVDAKGRRGPASRLVRVLVPRSQLAVRARRPRGPRSAGDAAAGRVGRC